MPVWGAGRKGKAIAASACGGLSALMLVGLLSLAASPRLGSASQHGAAPNRAAAARVMEVPEIHDAPAPVSYDYEALEPAPAETNPALFSLPALVGTEPAPSAPADEASEASDGPEASEDPVGTAELEDAASEAASRTYEAVAQEVVDTAMTQLGVPYGHPSNGQYYPGVELDCFTLVHYAWMQAAGIDIDNYEYDLMRASEGWVDDAALLEPGDLVWYSKDGGSSWYHVALYIGDGQVIHENGPSWGCVISPVLMDVGFVGGGKPVQVQEGALDG